MFAVTAASERCSSSPLAARAQQTPVIGFLSAGTLEGCVTISPPSIEVYPTEDLLKIAM
jgi:hypothetical protein